MDFYLFIVTVPNIEEANKIAVTLVESRLAACVNIIKDISSVYRWKGEIQEDNEQLLLIKTTEDKTGKSQKNQRIALNYNLVWPAKSDLVIHNIL